MSTIQLRRYELVPGLVDEFLAWFPQVVRIREQYGFRVLFALHDRPGNEFTWAVAHDDDFDEVERVYMASPERVAVFAGRPQYAAVMHITKVESVLG